MSEHSLKRCKHPLINVALACTIAFSGLGFASISSLANPQEALAVTAAEKKAEAAATLEKLDTLQDKLDEATDEHNQAVIEQQDARQKMDEAQSNIDAANEKISVLQDHLSTRARSMYRTGALSLIDVLLDSASFTDFTNNWGILTNMNESDAQMVQETKDLRSQVEEQKAVYTEQESIAAQKADEAAKAKEEAQVLVDEVMATYNALSAEAEQLLAQEEAARQAEQQRQAQAAIAAEQAKKTTSSSSTSSANNSKKPTVTGNTVVDRAYSMLGKAYVSAATGLEAFDCSGLVGYCLTGSTGRWCSTSTIQGWTKVTDPQPGDICIRPGHTGVYIGNGQMIHASSPKTGVIISAVQSGMWYVRY